MDDFFVIHGFTAMDCDHDDDFGPVRCPRTHGPYKSYDKAMAAARIDNEAGDFLIVNKTMLMQIMRDGVDALAGMSARQQWGIVHA